jgi:hypothetical protein
MRFPGSALVDAVKSATRESQSSLLPGSTENLTTMKIT